MLFVNFLKIVQLKHKKMLNVDSQRNKMIALTNCKLVIPVEIQVNLP